MPQAITVKIGAIGDPPLFPEHNTARPGEILAVSVLEAGMESGAASVGMVVEMDGKKAFIQMSAGMFHNINHILTGAEQRFLDARKGN